MLLRYWRCGLVVAAIGVAATWYLTALCAEGGGANTCTRWASAPVDRGH